MSDSLQTAQEWCNEARKLVNERTSKQLAKSLFDAAEGLRRAFENSNGRPPELSAKEWEAAQTEIAEARNGRIGAKSPAPSAKAVSGQQNNFEEYTDEIEPVIAKLQASTQKRKEALQKIEVSDLQAAKLALKGETKLKQIDDPAAALAEVKALQLRVKVATTGKSKALIAFMDLKAARLFVDRCAQQCSDLDLDDADGTASALEQLVAATELELKQVLALKKTLDDEPNKPTDEAIWRKLNANDQRVEEIRKAFPQVLADAKEVGKTNLGKKDQCATFGPRIQDALDAWSGYTVAQKLSTSDKDVGSIPWLEDKLNRLEAEPFEFSKPGDETAKLLKVQWTKLANEVWTGWAAFEATNFRTRALRGINCTPSLLTPPVHQELGEFGKVHAIKGKNFTVSHSNSTGWSLKRPIPRPTNGYMLNAAGDEIASYIYHLPANMQPEAI